MKSLFFLLIILAMPYELLTAAERPKVVIILGAPASGKGTQAEQLSKAMGIPHISTGDLFRENIAKNTALGQKVKSYMDEGKLVPDNLVLDVLFDRIEKNYDSRGFILDGFPRTIPQAEALEKKLPPNAAVIVLNLVVSDETIMKRALGRKRSDDTPEVVKKRLEAYAAQTAPLVDYYTKKGLLKNIDGEKSPDQVFEELTQAVSLPSPTGPAKP